MIAIITGPDSFTAREAVRRLRREFDPDGIGTSTIDGRTADQDEIVAAVSTPGFFGGGRVVIVEDAMARWTKRDADAADGQAVGHRVGGFDWSTVFAAVLAANAAIFVDRSLASVPVAVRTAAPAGTSFVVNDPPRGAELVRWIVERAARAGSTISDAHARLLAERLFPGTWATKPSNPAYDRPPDLDQFANEVDKLALAARPGSIERHHLHDFVAEGEVDRLFPFIDAVVAGNLRGAVSESATILGTDDNARATAQVYQQIELISALDAAGSGIDPVAVGRALGLSNPNRMIGVGKSRRAMRRPVKPWLMAALEVERRQKRGVLRQPETVLLSLVDTVRSEPGEHERGGT